MWQRCFGVLLALTLSACGRSPQPSVVTAVTAPVSASADGLCQHGLLESLCTRCHPALAPVFKGKGDWCDTHDFPESLCPQCHPERAGRPADSEGLNQEEGPAEGTRVRFKTKSTAQVLALRHVQVQAAPASTPYTFLAHVRAKPSRIAQLHAPLAGIVREVHVELGQHVEAGALLAWVESAHLGGEQARLQAARTRVQVATRHLSQLQALQPDGASTERELQLAHQERAQAQAELKAALASQTLSGAQAHGQGRYPLNAPFAGTITQQDARVGRFLEPETLAFELLDLSEVWLELDIPEAMLNAVQLGQGIRFESPSWPGERFEGTLHNLSPVLDPHTRTLKARARVSNPEGKLHVNLTGRASLDLALKEGALWVPREAVQRARNTFLVFVRLSTDTYEARRVTLGPSQDGFVAVYGQLKPGDTVVSEGSFLLKTETLRESIGAGCCEE